jgi:hypothetical protein
MPKKNARAQRRVASPRTAGKKKKSKKIALPAPRARRVNHNLPPGICRVEQPSTRTYGFVVRVGHRPSPKGWRPKYTAYFGDHSHGGKKAALAAATRWLKTLARTGKPPA